MDRFPFLVSPWFTMDTEHVLIILKGKHACVRADRHSSLILFIVVHLPPTTYRSSLCLLDIETFPFTQRMSCATRIGFTPICSIGTCMFLWYVYATDRGSVAAALWAGASRSQASMSQPGQLVEPSRAVGTGALSRAELSQPAWAGSSCCRPQLIFFFH